MQNYFSHHFFFLMKFGVKLNFYSLLIMLFYSGFCTEVEFNILYYIDQQSYSNVAFCDLTKNNRTRCSLCVSVLLIKRSCSAANQAVIYEECLIRTVKNAKLLQ